MCGMVTKKHSATSANATGPAAASYEHKSAEATIPTAQGFDDASDPTLARADAANEDSDAFIDRMVDVLQASPVLHLPGNLDDSVWVHLAGDTSEPFMAASDGQIAVKVIDHRGNELMLVRALPKKKPRP